MAKTKSLETKQHIHPVLGCLLEWEYITKKRAKRQTGERLSNGQKFK